MRKKLKRFKENHTNPLFIEPGKPFFERTKGNWHTFFGNKNPIVLELGCGTGNYAVKLAQQCPKQNFIGIDIKGARMWVGAAAAQQQQLSNVGFLRIRIHQLPDFFASNEVHEAYITFPDPRSKARDAKRRLTSKVFLNTYGQVMKKGGLVHLKTDHDTLYHDALAVIASLGYPLLANTDDLYKHHPNSLHAQIQTVYEKRFLAEGKKIKYLRFRLT